MRRKLKEFQGITLIALVITIIVLLILAGVSITMISSQDGILNKATSAKEANKKASEEESAKLAIQAALIDGEGTIDVSKLTEDSDIVKVYKEKGYDYKGEGKFRSKDGKEEISITETGEIEKIAVVSEVSKLTTEVTEITKYVDDTSTINQEAIIPRGFKVSSEAGEQKIDTGLVVIDKNGNEFVWIPVPDAIYDGTTEIIIDTYTPMARKIGNTENYQGVLYGLDQTKQKALDFSTYGVGTKKSREPSLIGSDAKYYNLAGNYSDVNAFEKDMQDEYNNMTKSVKKYRGFYVGRYETGIDKTSKNAVSKNASVAANNTTTADASQTDTKMWYGLYNKQRTMAKDNELDSVESSMMWGSQHDAMMIWMQKTGKKINKRIEGYNNTTITGSKDTDIINNVYDLYECHEEWTLKAYETYYRVCFGSGNDPSSSGFTPTTSLGVSSNDVDPYIGSRLSLYIK